MKRKDDEKDRFCSSRSKLDPIPLDLKMATVTRLPAKPQLESHQNKIHCGVESRIRLGGSRKRNRDEKDDTNPSKLDLDSLPLDLKMAILTRLPAKSLMNFRCVSKMWSSIIRSRGFIDSFYSMSSKQSRFIVALNNGVFGVPEEQLIFFFSFSHEGEDQSSSLVPKFEMALPSVGFTFHSGFCASLHGILTVEAECRVMLCNPSTEQVVKLPISTGTLVGYDPIDDQHKALSLPKRVRDDTSGHLVHNVLTLGGGQGWRHIKDTPLPHWPISPKVCINGFLYYGACCQTQTQDPVLVCFDVRSEKLSFINAPAAVLQWGKQAVLMEYKGKLASIVMYPYAAVCSFDLWILEDVQKHEWSRQTCVFPNFVWDSVAPGQMSFPGTNKAGEIIMASRSLSRNVQPFYIFYYNVETKNLRRVRLLGIGDDEEFRRSYGFGKKGECIVHIAHQHVESIAFFKDPVI